MRRVDAAAVVILTTMLVGALGHEAVAGRRAGQPPPPKIKQEPAPRIPSIEGKDAFAAYCAVCHGADGKGQGPAAAALAKPVPDLTQIASRHGGKFDQLAIEAAIMGRDRMPASHGTVDMPIWGPVFREVEGSPHRVALRLTNLVKYLESIQQK